VSSGHGTDPAGNPLDRFGLSRPVWQLGWVSFFTDTASEMIYPLLPLFLTQTLGAGAMSLGVIEGVAEAVNSLLKIVSGRLTDRWGIPKALVLGGYSLSSIVRPLIALVTAWPQVLLIRLGDRLGKGIRTPPRDALLAGFAPPDRRGRVYGFHRAMDHAGAFAGPLIAAAFLYYRPGDYRTLFGWTLLPGILVVVLILALPEPRREKQREVQVGAPAAPLSQRFYLAIAIVSLFSLGNATDAFLLLRLSNEGISAEWIPLLWSGLHVVKMASSVVGGTLSDRLGRPAMIALGYLWYAAIYAGFGFFGTAPITVALFLAYGLYFGLTEGVEKAWVADLVPADRRGHAFGIYNAALGFGGLAASLLFGLLWTAVSPRAAFLTGAGLALGASALLVATFPARRR
jgi:MFS family permease